MLALGNYYGHFRNNGGIITIKNGIFKSNEITNFFNIEYGKLIIYDGIFEGNGVFIDATGNFLGTEVTIEGGTFNIESSPALRFYAYCSPLNVKLENCSISSKNSHAISINDSEYGLEEKLGVLTLDGCYIEGDEGAILLNSQSNYSLSGWTTNLINCSLKSLSKDKKLGAIWSDYYNESESIIKNIFSNYTSDIFITKYYTDMQETTYKELVFENGKLIYAVGDPNDMEDDIVDGKEENEQTESNTSNENEPNNEINFSENSAIQEETTIVSSLENTGTQEITTAEKNDNKLPQTGTEEDNKFTKWLTAVISLGIFWLISMLLIDYKKEKINQSQKGGKHNGSR